MSSELPSELRELAATQRGVVTAGQLVTAGVGREMPRSRVKQGRWQRLHRGVYATFSGEPSREATLWAAVLWAGSGAMLSHRSAAALDKLTDEVGELVHVTIPAERRVCRTAGIVVHRSSRANRSLHPAFTPPRTRVEETILDLAAAATTLDEAVGWVARGLGRRLTVPGRLRLALDDRATMRWRRELTELLTDEM